MKDRVISIIGEVLNLPKKDINEKTNLINDLDLDSLDLVELIAAFENEYGVEILDKDIKNLQTVNDIIKYLESKNV